MASSQFVVGKRQLSKYWASLEEMSAYREIEEVKFFTHCTKLWSRRQIIKDGRVYGFDTDVPKQSPLAQNPDVGGVWLSVSLYNGNLPFKSPYGTQRIRFPVSDIMSFMCFPSADVDEELDSDDEEDERSVTDCADSHMPLDDDSNEILTEGRMSAVDDTRDKDKFMSKNSFENEAEDKVYDDETKTGNVKIKYGHRDKPRETDRINDSGYSETLDKQNKLWGEHKCDVYSFDENVRNGTVDEDEHERYTKRAGSRGTDYSSDIDESCNSLYIAPTMSSQTTNSLTVSPLLFFECAHYFNTRDQYVRLVMARSDNKHINWCKENLLALDIRENPFLSWNGLKAYTVRNSGSCRRRMFVELLVVGDIVLEKISDEWNWEKVGKAHRALRGPLIGVYRKSN